jgi:hypothetical protein
VPQASTNHVLRALLELYARAELTLDRVRNARAAFVSALLSHALTLEQKAELTVHLYAMQHARSHRQQPGLPAWELAWFSAQLPPPDARILLGGAGAGREAAWLNAAGYRVDAFEPAASCAESLRASVGSRGESVVASYADLIEARLRRQQHHAIARFAERQYDAVLLGWSSLTHVLGQAAREELLRVCAALCPAGPILASFYCSDGAASTRGSRANVLGATVGMRLASARGREPANEPGDDFFPHAGFAHTSTPAEIEHLATAIGRPLLLELAGYPHATFYPAKERTYGNV